MLFTIIIPVYNASPFLRECLDSVRNQTFQDWEAICIDDGSSDGSEEILDKYSENDKRIKVIHQSNLGASIARNNGLEVAKGQWICFLDADDLLECHVLEYCAYVSNIVSDVDLIRFSGVKFSNHEIPKLSECTIPSLTPKMLMEDISNRVPSSAIGSSFTCRAYRRVKLSDIRFKQYVLGEDLLFLYHVMDVAKKQIYIDWVGYGYRQQKDSVSHQNDTVALLLDTWHWRGEWFTLLERSRKKYDHFLMNNCINGMIENGGARLLKMLGDERSLLLNTWNDVLEKIQKSNKASTFQRIRATILRVFSCCWLIRVLCVWPLRIKQLGVHR